MESGNIHVDLYILEGVLIQKEDTNTYLIKQIPHDAIIHSNEDHPETIW